MKKTIFISLFLIFSTLSFSQNGAKKLDPKLFGTWNGSENDNQRKGLSKSWVMHRFENGTFVLLFTNVEDGEVTHFAEKGRWWIDEKGIFNEYHNNSKKTDTYTYIMIDENNVKFKSKFLSMSHENQDYEFIDTKLNDDL